MDVLLNSVGSKLQLAPTKKTPTDETPAKSGAPETVTSKPPQPGASLQLRALMETASSAPIVDREKVSRIAHAIDSGQYQPDAQRAADKLVEFEFLIP